MDSAKYPLISICIPTYNRASMLKRALQSALTQDYQNIEVVVSDNASTDGTQNIVHAFNDPRVRYYRNPYNVGALINFRRAVYDYAQGKYAIFLADDDYFLDCFYISKAVRLLEDNPHMVFVFSNWRAIKNETQCHDFLSDLPEIIPGDWLVYRYFGYDRQMYGDIYNHWITGSAIYLYTVVFVRKIVIDIDPLSDNYLDRDKTFIYTLCMHGSVGFINAVALVMNYHQQQATATAGFEAYLQNLFRKTLDITDYMLAQGAPAKLIRKIRFKHLCLELRPMIANTIDQRVNQQDNNSSLWRIAIKAFKTNPLLLMVFFRYKILGALLLSVSPRLYNYFKKRFGKNWDYFQAISRPSRVRSGG
jgi:glycosyltransferase involved in cell wall biosynthesis